ncbi:hypothetical protein Taro_025767 [Colocasia esculenta]|uniref:Cytochrome P450 71A1 n=1 Tax=Colocasia esculenta TaxID=4460 RepID=A0A843VA71_COLES|nr:hypothetical protein [Colocasia esculenta]
MATHDGVLLLLMLPLLSLVLVWFILGNGRQKHHKLPPGPPGLPLIGNLHQLGQNPHRTLWELSKQYGPLMRLRLGNKPCVVVSSAQMAEAVMKTHDLKFCSRPLFTSWKRLTHDFNDVAFSPYSETWRELRKVIVLGFLSTRRVEGFQSAREEEVERMIGFISSQASLSKPINLSKLLTSLANEVTWGRRERPEENKFYRITKETQALLVATFMADYFPCAGWLDVLAGRRARLEKNFAEFDAFFREVIKAHSTDPSERPPQGDHEEDITDMLLRLQREDAHITEKHVKGLLFDIILGGTDTSSATLEYAMAELMRNPNAMSKAQDEVRGVVGNKGKVEDGDIARLSYLRCVVKETLRLHPVVPLLVHRETMGHTNINGYDVPPKTQVLVNAWAIGREMAFWEKPEAFIPERFIGSKVDFKGHDFQFIPFGAGRRICPGITFGVMLVELALANLLYAFNWEVMEEQVRRGEIDMAEGTGVTTHLKNNLHLKATRYSHRV